MDAKEDEIDIEPMAEEEKIVDREDPTLNAGSECEVQKVNIAVVGCGHGKLDDIYACVTQLRETEGKVVDLLIICGDFQAVRHSPDLNSMHVPEKYRSMMDFYKYYQGTSKAPCLTLYIGGNHEAVLHHRQLFHGGWVAPNIYFLGYSGVVKFAGLRIAGLSGIFKHYDYMKTEPMHRNLPFNINSMTTSYHIKKFEAYKLSLLREPVDIFLSHDWPLDAVYYGNIPLLVKKKPFFLNDILRFNLGNPVASQLLHQHRPSYWFSGHLHVAYPALIDHEKPLLPGFSSASANDKKDKNRFTRFLALDKCISPSRQFLQVIEMTSRVSHGAPLQLEYDSEWLSIVKGTNQLMFAGDFPLPMNKDIIFPEEYDWVTKNISSLMIPHNFQKTMTAFDPKLNSSPYNSNFPDQISLFLHDPQTRKFCQMLEIDSPFPSNPLSMHSH